MTGAEHKAEAERLMAEVATIPPTQRRTEEARRLLAAAQIHATLATVPGPAPAAPAAAPRPAVPAAPAAAPRPAVPAAPAAAAAPKPA